MRNLELEIRRRLRRPLLHVHSVKVSTIPFSASGATNESGAFLLTNAETDVADGLRAEAFFELLQDVDLRDLIELVVQNRLEHTDIENSVTQRERRRMRGDELTNDLGPCVDYFSFMQALTKSHALHQLWNQFRRRLPAVHPHFSLRQAAPFGDHGGAKRGVHRFNGLTL